MNFSKILSVFLFAASAKAQSDDDLFDSSKGTVVLEHDTIIAPLNVFTKTGGFENGNTLMRNGGIDSVSFIKFQTICPVTIDSARLLAASDGPDSYRRAMKGFKLLADTNNDGTSETTVVDDAISPTYSSLDETYDFEPVRAQVWRMEVTQGTNVQPFEGVRVQELDGFGSRPFCASSNVLSDIVDNLDVNPPQFLRSLQAKINVVQKKLSEGDIAAVNDALCSLKDQVEAQKGKKINEASANNIADCICEFQYMSGGTLQCS